MENKISSIDDNVAKFLNDILLNKSATIESFEKKLPELKFDGDNAKVWQFIVLKSFEPDFYYLFPLANHLVDNDYFEPTNATIKYAALSGYQIELMLDKIKEVEDGINDNMKSFHFDEKLVITNEPAKMMYDLYKKIINRSSDEDYEDVKRVFEQSGINVESVKIMQKPEVSKKLKP